MSDLEAKIDKYFNSTSLYPLLVVVPTDEYRVILEKFSSVKKVKVSSYCVGADKEPDTEKLVGELRNLQGNYFLVGLGDYLANKGIDAKNLLLPYKNIELCRDSRLVVLLSAHMYPIAKEILDSDLRLRTRFVLPKYVPEIPAVDNNALVYGIQKYLEDCEDARPPGSIKTERRITQATVINPESAFDELSHKFPDLLGNLPKETGTAENWAELLSAVNKSGMSLMKYVGVRNFSAEEYIFLDHAKSDNYDSWLFFLYLKITQKGQNYLNYVTSKTVRHSQLFENAKTSILDIHVSDERFNEFYLQRKKLLKNCSDTDMADYIPKIGKHGADCIAYLTDNTKIERQNIIVSLSEGAKGEYVRKCYPDLYFYLQDYQFLDKSTTKYFASYKRCKVYNKIDDDFAAIVKSNAINRPYNSFPPLSSVFTSINHVGSDLVFMDALGVEFLGYIKEVCAELKLRFDPIVARANLPTVTSQNRAFYDDWKESKETPIKDLDELKHNPERGYDFNNSPYPVHLTEELEVVREALNRAKVKLDSGRYRKVIIASDHGASRLAVICADEKIDPAGCAPKSGGRYCQGLTLPEADFIAHEGDDFAVIADYSRFDGSRISSVEVHGGATLEEVLVPIIELTSANEVHVILESNVIELSYKTTPELILKILPDCDNITAKINGIECTVVKTENTRFKIDIQNLKKGTYILSIFENQNKIAGDLEFTVKSKGFGERKMF